MKGYVTANGYMGWMPTINAYVLFATESDYKEIYDDICRNKEGSGCASDV